MPRQLALLFPCLLLLLPLGAQEPQIEVDGKVTVVQMDKVVVLKEDRRVVETPFKLKAPKGGILYQWDYPAGIDAVRRGSILEIKSAPKGSLTVSVGYAVVDFDKRTVDDRSLTLTIDVDAVVPPAPPVPPGPKPVPFPPEPEPKPPAPIPAAGFRVLIVYESEDLGKKDSQGKWKVPPSQVSILTAKAIRDYLDLRCVSGPDYKEYRIWDQNVSTANVSKVWQDAMARPRTALPWILISNGISGYEGPLPATVDETLELLKKYGGV